MNWVMIGAPWGLAGVGLGAFGAHGLKTVASAEGIAWWETAARYHLFHALALVALGLVQHHRYGGDSAGRASWPGAPSSVEPSTQWRWARRGGWARSRRGWARHDAGLAAARHALAPIAAAPARGSAMV